MAAADRLRGRRQEGERENWNSMLSYSLLQVRLIYIHVLTKFVDSNKQSS
jgi:hypothetical protein